MLYNLSRASEDGKIPFLSQLLEKSSDFQTQWSERNQRHVAMLEQAAYDRHLFQQAEGDNTVEMKNPE